MALISLAAIDTGNVDEFMACCNEQTAFDKTEVLIGTLQHSKPETFNLLLKQSTGKFLVPVETSWYLKPNFLESMLAPLRSGRAAISTPLVEVDGISFMPPNYFSPENLLGEMFHQVFMTTRELWAGVGGFQEEWGDHFFWDFFASSFYFGMNLARVEADLVSMSEKEVPTSFLKTSLRNLAITKYLFLFMQTGQTQDLPKAIQEIAKKCKP